MIDSGVDGSGPELTGRVSAQSIDASATRNTPVGTDGHATWVAGILANNFNGQGTVGVAYNSTVLSVRADTTTTTTTACGTDVCISANLAAQGIDYAISHG
ncbi:MAG: S8 family serine peptidase [Caulobacteraceae bacterium]